MAQVGDCDGCHRTRHQCGHCDRIATTVPPDTEPAGTEPAGTEAAGDAMSGYDESAKCGTDEYEGNLASLQAPDPYTVVMTLCNPDVAIPAKVAFASLGIVPSETLDDADGLINNPVGTGPYSLGAWERESQIVLEANPEYWGEAPLTPTAVFQWNNEGSQRLVQLQSGAADAIDNLGPNDYAAVEGDANLSLVERSPLNVAYLGFNVDMSPFDDPLVRQAIALAVDRQRLIDNFYPRGSVAASQFLPPAMFGFDESFVDFERNIEEATALLTEAGYPDGLDVTLSYRAEARPYVAQPTEVVTDIQAQLAEIGINVTLDLQESTTFVDNTSDGNVPFYLLGWGADFPDPTNFMDYHFTGTFAGFGAAFPDIAEKIAEAGSTVDADARAALYAEINALLAEHIPMVPLAYSGSAMGYRADVVGAHASPLTSERLAVMQAGDRDQLVLVQNGEPGGLYCSDETDGEALRICEQIVEPLLQYETGGTASEPALAESYESNEDLTVWTFHLRQGVTFQDGSEFDATDVIESYRVQWDASDPRHVGREGNFDYWGALFGGFVNVPPPEPVETTEASGEAPATTEALATETTEAVATETTAAG